MMRFLCSLAVFGGFGAAQIPPWIAPGPDDARGPCPGLNTLANHGLLPRSGRNITQADLTAGMLQGVSQDSSISIPLFRVAATTSPTCQGNTSFNLDTLGTHNIVEHDASLSRQDAFFGNQLPFNQTVFDRTLAQWTDEVITINSSAAARAAAIRYSNATNPAFGLSTLAQGFSTGESIAFILVFGNVTTGVVETAPVVYWFENERFPPGYVPPVNTVTSAQLQDLQGKLDDALLAQGLDISAIAAPPASASKRWDPHVGLW